MIAHRLSTIRNADKIVCISRGRKREEGSHDELIEFGGLYAQFMRLQVASCYRLNVSDRELVIIMQDNRGSDLGRDDL